MAAINDVIKIAEAEVGYLEKASNSQLDSKTANAGSNNYTKYARDYNVFAGASLQGQPWCDMFVDWCFVQAYGKAVAKKMLGGFSAYTPTSASYLTATSSPAVGDIIFFKDSSRICHTGIICAVNSSTVYTIEGNTSGGTSVVANGGGVFKKLYSRTNSRIAKYGRPKWEHLPAAEGGSKIMRLFKPGLAYVTANTRVYTSTAWTAGVVDMVVGNQVRILDSGTDAVKVATTKGGVTYNGYMKCAYLLPIYNVGDTGQLLEDITFTVKVPKGTKITTVDTGATGVKAKITTTQVFDCKKLQMIY